MREGHSYNARIYEKGGNGKLETRKINTRIKNIEEAKGKFEPFNTYWKVHTEYMSSPFNIHEEGLMGELMPFIGEMCNIIISESPKKDGNGVWHNIKGIVKSDDDKINSRQTIPPIKIANTNRYIDPSEMGNLKPVDNKFTTMYVSYAKDIFVAMIGKLEHKEIYDGPGTMGAAIQYVKQARDAFS